MEEAPARQAPPAPREQLTVEKYLELLQNVNLEEARQGNEDDMDQRFGQKWLQIKTFLTFNAFLFGFPTQYCDEEHSFG